MIIELPRKFTFFNETGEKVAYINEQGILILKEVSFRKVMFELAYEMKGRNRCCYCGKIIKEKQITIDHMYPQDFGGPTITNNLLPSCQECNNEKGNLTTKQYKNSTEKLTKIYTRKQIIQLIYQKKINNRRKTK